MVVLAAARHERRTMRGRCRDAENVGLAGLWPPHWPAPKRGASTAGGSACPGCREGPIRAWQPGDPCPASACLSQACSWLLSPHQIDGVLREAALGGFLLSCMFPPMLAAACELVNGQTGQWIESSGVGQEKLKRNPRRRQRPAQEDSSRTSRDIQVPCSRNRDVVIHCGAQCNRPAADRGLSTYQRSGFGELHHKLQVSLTRE